MFLFNGYLFLGLYESKIFYLNLLVLSWAKFCNCADLRLSLHKSLKKYSTIFIKYYPMRLIHDFLKWAIPGLFFYFCLFNTVDTFSWMLKE